MPPYTSASDPDLMSSACEPVAKVEAPEFDRQRHSPPLAPLNDGPKSSNSRAYMPMPWIDAGDEDLAFKLLGDITQRQSPVAASAINQSNMPEASLGANDRLKRGAAVISKKVDGTYGWKTALELLDDPAKLIRLDTRKFEVAKAFIRPVSSTVKDTLISAVAFEKYAARIELDVSSHRISHGSGFWITPTLFTTDAHF